MPGAAKLQPRFLDRDGIRYRIDLPRWGQWLRILDHSARGLTGADQADIGPLLRLWLGQSVQIDREGALFSLGAVETLPAPLADALIAAGTEALAELEAALDLREEPAAGDQWRLFTCDTTYVLRPLTFAERNACLSRNLALRAGQPEMDASAYEVALVAASLVAQKDGAPPLGHRALMDLPMPVGEALVSLARRLSDPAAEEEIASFAAAGLPHPDLDLAALCLTYRISPAEARALPAAEARRLLAAARLLQAAQPMRAAPSAPMAPLAEDDRVTRIVVHDD